MATLTDKVKQNDQKEIHPWQRAPDVSLTHSRMLVHWMLPSPSPSSPGKCSTLATHASHAFGDASACGFQAHEARGQVLLRPGRRPLTASGRRPGGRRRGHHRGGPGASEADPGLRPWQGNTEALLVKYAEIARSRQRLEEDQREVLGFFICHHRFKQTAWD